MTIRAYVFDAYGTLFDVHAAVRRCAAAVGPQHEAVSALWRSKQLEYTWVRTLMGRYVDFWRCTEDALDFALAFHGRQHMALRADLLSAYRTLDAYADARPALQALRKAGHGTAILSNGSPAMLQAAVESAGLGDVLDAVLSVDGLRRYKTAPETYALATAHFGLAPSEISFQSSNTWDAAGAAAFGLRCVRVNRLGLPAEYGDVMQPLVVKDLRELLAIDAA
jgi:2-haloacid dehalogenase